MNSVKAEFFPPHKQGRSNLYGTADTDVWVAAIGDVGARRRSLSYAGFKRIMNTMLDELGTARETEARIGTGANDGEAKRDA
jgi:hypothetical protein